MRTLCLTVGLKLENFPSEACSPKVCASALTMRGNLSTIPEGRTCADASHAGLMTDQAAFTPVRART
jgi:hypothetical protein